MPFCNIMPSEVSLLRSTLNERPADDVSIADNAVIVAENAMKRYVAQRLAQLGYTRGEGETASSSPSWFDAVKEGVTVTVREYPYESLFLYPLPSGVCEHPHAPPSFLVAPPQDSGATTKITATTVDCGSGGGGATRRKYRDMFFLNGGATEIVTVLQSECGLAVASPPPSSTSSGRCGAYLMSPDATSCTIVACRVGLHPEFGSMLMAATEVEGAAPEDVVLVRRCGDVFTAAMGHFDRPEGLSQALHEILWESALPAWFHTVVLRSSSDVVGTGQDVVRAVTMLVARLRRIAHAATTTSTGASAPTLLVEWFVVGGIRSRRHTIPVLSAIFGAFFSAEEGQGSDAGPPHARRHILAPSFRVPEVFGDVGGLDEADTTVLLQHRLREDGVCFWSLNTVLRQWALGRAGVMYSCAACWGLLVDVAGGGCWPVAVQPSTRNYPLAALRHILVSKPYHWTSPLQREGAVRVSYHVKTADATAFFGLEPSGAELDVASVDLLMFIDLFLRRSERGTSGDEKLLQRSSHAPVLVRCGMWEQPCDLNEETLNSLPDAFFLTASTTPQCEPSDFVAIARQQLTIMSRITGEDVFETGTVGILF